MVALTMGNTYFQFKQFVIHQDKSAMKVSTDGCILGAWAAQHIPPSAKNILDIGSGTGVLMLMIAQKFPVEISGIEMESEAFKQGTQNLKESPWSGKLNNYYGDVRSFSTEKKFDFIISNPPFHENQLKGPVSEKNLAHHSTLLNLDELLGAIKNLLSENGRFMLLIPHYRKAELVASAASYGFYPFHELTIHSSPLHSPFRLIISFAANKEAEHKNEKFVIKDSTGNYTVEFKTLMQDYYLHL